MSMTHRVTSVVRCKSIRLTTRVSVTTMSPKTRVARVFLFSKSQQGQWPVYFQKKKKKTEANHLTLKNISKIKKKPNRQECLLIHTY